MQHEPIGDNHHRGEQTEFPDWSKVDKEPDPKEKREIREGGQCDCRTDLAQPEANPDGDRVRERNRKYRLGLFVSSGR